MRVLVTRSSQEIQREIAALNLRGHKAISSPLLQIKPIEGPQINLEGSQAILISSRAGVRALAKVSKERKIPVFTVGDSTADVALDLGYKRVESAHGDSKDLLVLSRRRLIKGAGKIFIASGADVVEDLEEHLEKDGFEVERRILYEASLVDNLSAYAEKCIRARKIDVVLFFSARTADSFVKIVIKSNLEEACSTMNAVCLSERVAKQASKISWLRVCFAKKPDRDSLYSLLESIQ